MTRLNSSQLRALNRVLLALYEDVSEADPIEPVVELIETLLPNSWISVDEVSLATGRVRHVSGRRLEPVAQLPEKIALYCHQNPVVSYAIAGNFAPALRVSDFTTLRQFKLTDYFNEMVGFFPKWRDQAALPVRLPGSSLGFALNRDRIITDEEITMLELLQPHVERVLSRSTQYLTLPTEKPLTPREREVLHWVAEGKRDAEIAVILGNSVRTVEQHVRICLRKLGVETRVAACAAIWRARQQPL